MKKVYCLTAIFAIFQTSVYALPFELNDAIREAREAYMSKEPEQCAVNRGETNEDLTKCSGDKPQGNENIKETDSISGESAEKQQNCEE